MKKFFLAGSLLTALFSQAQLVNNGATIVVQSGGSIFCAGNFTNTSGTVTNDGKIEVQGDFSNAATYNSTTSDDSLILSGNVNSLVNGGGATFRFLTINKAANTNTVTLNGNIVVSNKLDYLAGTLLTTPAFNLSAPVASVFNFGAGREIIGNVKRTSWANGSTIVFNSANLQMTTAGGTAPTELMANMLPDAYGGDPTQTEREVKRKFVFTPTGGAGFTTDIRFPYLDAELNVGLNSNTEGNLVPWNFMSSEWNARLTPVTRDAASNWVNTTGVDATSLAQEWKLADPRYAFNITARLRGAWNGTDMNTSLNAFLPTTQPYGTAAFASTALAYSGTETASPMPANAVDWVLVDFRKPASLAAPETAGSSTFIGRKAGLLLNTGVIVNGDGTPLSFDITKQGGGFFVIRHRNHLGVMSNALLSNEAGTFANDFSVLANAYKSASIASQPLVLLSAGNYGLWAGDANVSGNIAASDVNNIKAAISNGLPIFYQTADVNMSANLAAADVNLSKLMISNGGEGSNPARLAQKVKSHLPGTPNE